MPLTFIYLSKIEKNKGKDNYLETKELHDLSRDVHSVDYEISRAQAHMTYHNSGKNVNLLSNLSYLKRVHSNVSFSYAKE